MRRIWLQQFSQNFILKNCAISNSGEFHSENSCFFPGILRELLSWKNEVRAFGKMLLTMENSIIGFRSRWSRSWWSQYSITRALKYFSRVPCWFSCFSWTFVVAKEVMMPVYLHGQHKILAKPDWTHTNKKSGQRANKLSNASKSWWDPWSSCLLP